MLLPLLVFMSACKKVTVEFNLVQSKTQVELYESFLLGVDATGGTYNIDVNWGDGTIETSLSGLAFEHFYTTAGTYTVTVTVNCLNDNSVFPPTKCKVSSSSKTVTYTVVTQTQKLAGSYSSQTTMYNGSCLFPDTTFTSTAVVAASGSDVRAFTILNIHGSAELTNAQIVYLDQKDPAETFGITLMPFSFAGNVFTPSGGGTLEKFGTNGFKVNGDYTFNGSCHVTVYSELTKI